MCPSEPHTGEDAVTGQGLQLLSWTSGCPASLTLQVKRRGEEFQFIKRKEEDAFLIVFFIGRKTDANKDSGSSVKVNTLREKYSERSSSGITSEQDTFRVQECY